MFLALNVLSYSIWQMQKSDIGITQDAMEESLLLRAAGNREILVLLERTQLAFS